MGGKCPSAPPAPPPWSFYQKVLWTQGPFDQRSFDFGGPLEKVICDKVLLLFVLFCFVKRVVGFYRRGDCGLSVFTLQWFLIRNMRQSPCSFSLLCQPQAGQSYLQTGTSWSRA